MPVLDCGTGPIDRRGVYSNKARGEVEVSRA